MRSVISLAAVALIAMLGSPWFAGADVFQDAEEGDLSAVKAFLDGGGDVNASDANRATVLHHAVTGNQLDVVKLLMERKADLYAPRLDHVTPVDLAGKLGLSPIIKLFIAEAGRVPPHPRRQLVIPDDTAYPVKALGEAVPIGADVAGLTIEEVVVSAATDPQGKPALTVRVSARNGGDTPVAPQFAVAGYHGDTLIARCPFAGNPVPAQQPHAFTASVPTELGATPDVLYVVSQEPKDIEAMRSLVAQGYNTHYPEEAQVAFKRVERRAAVSDYHCRVMAWAKQQLCRYADAVPYAEEAQRLFPCGMDVIDLCQAYRLAGRFAQARAVLREFRKTDRYQWEAKQQPQWTARLRGIHEEVATKVVAFSKTFDERRFNPDFGHHYREAGFWDIPVPVESPYLQCRVFLTNARSYREVVDTAGARRYRVVPQDIDKPVVARMVVKETRAFIDLDEATTPYSVPEQYRPYLGTTTDIDPTTPLAAFIAAPLRGRTIRETIENVNTWVTLNIADPLPVDPKDKPQVPTDWVPDGAGEWHHYDWNHSEVALRTHRTACAGHATATCALLRALGLAARWGGGLNHAWPEVWVPPFGWVPLQNWVPVGWTDWNCIRMVLEPLDDSSYFPLLPCFPSDINTHYMGNVNGFFVGGTDAGDYRVIGKSLDDISIDDAIKADEQGKVLTDGLFD